jgi:hypothetical protein
MEQLLLGEEKKKREMGKRKECKKNTVKGDKNINMKNE